MRFAVLAASNRVLAEEIRADRFREDLFHRPAVDVPLIPPLRQRDPWQEIRICSHARPGQHQALVNWPQKYDVSWLARNERLTCQVLIKPRLVALGWSGQVCDTQQ